MSNINNILSATYSETVEHSTESWDGNQGRGRSVQGSGRFGGRGFNRKSNKENKEKKKDDNEYQFAPYQDGKMNVKTYTSVKEHV